MRPVLRTLFTCILLLVVLGNRIASATPADDLLDSLKATADVNDFAGILSPAEKEALEQSCRQLREKSGAQLAVVILRSLNGGQIDDFTVKLFERWKVGQAGKNNGVMLLVALNDRKARIEVGYGLEPILPDALAGRVLEEQLFPAFRQQKYAAGLSATVNRIVEIIERNEPAPANLLRRNQGQIPGAIFGTLLAIAFIFAFSLFLGVCLRRRQWGAAGVLLLFPLAGMVIAKSAGLPWWAMVILMMVAIAGAVLGYQAGKEQKWKGRRWNPSSTWPPVTTWPVWGSGGSSWSGGGFSGGGGGGWGGFGGGSSGGGGASGSW